MNTLLVIAGLVIAFFGGSFFSRKNNKQDDEMMDLASVTKLNRTKLVLTEKEANDKVSDYQNARKKYDPTFNPDDDGGKPTG